MVFLLGASFLFTLNNEILFLIRRIKFDLWNNNSFLIVHASYKSIFLRIKYFLRPPTWKLLNYNNISQIFFNIIRLSRFLYDLSIERKKKLYSYNLILLPMSWVRIMFLQVKNKCWFIGWTYTLHLIVLKFNNFFLILRNPWIRETSKFISPCYLNNL